MTPQHWRLAVAAELVLGGILGSLFLGTHSLFLDESVSATLATAPWHRFANVVTHREANMALYYLLLRGWVVFGHSEIALRSLSVILAVGALWIVILLARSLFGQRAALLAGVLFAVNPLFIQFAQDVRGYSLALLLVSASCFFFVRGIQQVDPPPRFCWTAYTDRHRAGGLHQLLGCPGPRWRRRSRWPSSRPGGSRGAGSCRRPSRWSCCLSRWDCSFRPPTAPASNWASGSSAGRLFTHIRSSVPHVALDAAGARRGRRRRRRDRAGPPPAGHRRVLRSRVAAVLHRVLAGRPGGRRGDAVAGRQAAARRALPDGQPSRGDPAGGAGDRPHRGARPSRRASPWPRCCSCSSSPLSAVGAAQWYSKGGPQDFRSAVASIADRAQPGDGVLIFQPYERIPVEWYLDDRPATEREVKPVYPATAWGVDPAGLRRQRVLQPGRDRAGRREVPAHLGPERHGRPVAVPRPGGLGQCRPAPGGLHACRHHGVPRGRRSPRRYGSEPATGGDEPGRGRPGRGCCGRAPAVPRLAGLAHPGRAREDLHRTPGAATGHCARPDGRGAGLQGSRRHRRQGGGPAGQRVSRLARGPGGRRRRPRDGRCGRASRSPRASAARNASASPRPSTGDSPRPRHRSW